MSKRQPSQVEKRPRRAQETGIPDAWTELGVSRLGRDPHVRRCLLCKALLSACAGANDDEYLTEAVTVIKGCRKRHRKDATAGKGCEWDGCVLHEDIPAELAREMIRLGGGDEPWRDIRGVRVSCTSFIVREQDHPEGFDMTKQDITHRYYKYLKPEAGFFYVRFAPKRTTVHLCCSPAYVSRREDINDTPTVADIVEVHEKKIPAIREWVMNKYNGLKKLAEAELAEEKAKKEKL